MDTLASRPDRGLFTLPGGYLDARGTCHRQVTMRALNGREEELVQEAVSREWSQAALATAILTSCVERVGSCRSSGKTVSQLMVGDRDYLMVQLRRMTFGDQVCAVLRCPRLECGKRMDVDFGLDDLPVDQRIVASTYRVVLPDSAAFLDQQGRPQCEVHFRLPCGADLEAASEWRSGDRPCDEAELVTRLLARCLLRLGEVTMITPGEVARLSETTRLAIEREIEHRSPRVHQEIGACCPECGYEFIAAFDATAFFFHEIVMGSTLDREIHLLSLYYHWPLRETLALTRGRRLRYLRLLRQHLTGFSRVTGVSA
jgi:hypothetical protein